MRKTGYFFKIKEINATFTKKQLKTTGTKLNV